MAPTTRLLLANDPSGCFCAKVNTFAPFTTTDASAGANATIGTVTGT